MQRVRRRVMTAKRRFIPLVAHGLIAGLISGIILGITIKLLGKMTGSAIYVLLLNVDFVDWLPNPMSELAEFMLHLSVAMPLGILFFGLLRLWKSPLVLGLSSGAVIACCTWIPLTQLSDRVPDTLDVEALLWWVVGHVIYGAVLAGFGSLWIKRGWYTI